MTAYWRIRLKNQDGEFADDAWRRNEVGIWYGAWSPDDFRNVDQPDRTNQQIADLLNNLPNQRNLIDSEAWDGPISASYIGTARRFFDKVAEGDWATKV
jgi:hypothetical protein